MSDNPERTLAIGLAAGRLAIGAGLWLAPRLSARLLGFGAIDDKALALSRIAASRDLVLGAWQLSSLEDHAALRRATAAVAAADGGDALTFALATRSPDPAVRRAGLRGVVAAVPATLAGAWLHSRLRSK